MYHQEHLDRWRWPKDEDDMELEVFIIYSRLQRLVLPLLLYLPVRRLDEFMGHNNSSSSGGGTRGELKTRHKLITFLLRL